MAKTNRPSYDEPNMSDTALLVTVEDLINRAMGPPDANVVNFKVIQAVLHILARQQRILEQRVEIRIAEGSPPRQKVKKQKVVQESSESSSSVKSPRPKPKMGKIKEEREPKTDKALKEKERAEKLAQKEQRAASKERDKQERAISKERDKQERAASKEREKQERAISKEQEKEKRMASKEREKEERAASKERDKEERAASREREKQERASSKEREKSEKYAQKEHEKAGKQAQKEQEKTKKDQEKAEKQAQREQEKAQREQEKTERHAQKDQVKAQKEIEKADKQALKDQERVQKEQRNAQKEIEKADKQALKDQERVQKEQRNAQKELEKADKHAQKEQERAQKEQEKAGKAAKKDEEMAEKERQKAEKQAQKEQERAEKLSQKEREKAEKAAAKEKETPKSPIKEKKPSETRISVSDIQTRGSIEVVTQSQFALLEAAVKELKDMAAPMKLAMPDNERLRSDLAKGSASLSDTMQAMQIDARVKAAESAISRMTGLLTQLAAAGGLPEDLEQQMEVIQTEQVAAEAQAVVNARPSMAGPKSVAISPSAKESEMLSRPSMATTARPSMSIMKQPSSRVSTATLDAVTHDELEDSVNRLREELIKSMNTMTSRAGATADNALHTAKAVADKLDIALSLDVRIATLQSLAVDYAEQLHGFDAGLSTQMQSFREQMVQMRTDLQGGLTQLEGVNNNAETAAVTELTGRYQDLVTELDSTLHAHRSLTKFQTQLAEELRSLVECVEMLREQKADKDEVADGLRDKADTSRLAGLLTESEFALARADLERRLAVCHDKFQRQDGVWMTAMKDLNKILDGKSEIISLLSARDELQKELQILHERVQILAAVLGEPKAAIVKRQLAVGASCAACGAAALMSPRGASQGAPPRLPALRPPPVGAPSDQPCFKEWMPPELPDNRHVCHRWCGGSHTMVSENTKHEQATELPALEHAPPTKRYTGYGSDGRLYMMEEDLQPCIECNEMVQKTDDIPPLNIGAGDQSN
ncbi:unnamed protein product [Leptosia nina]|uniref:DUF4795 domain-containing protein n=1 Tax=Leptosia nina TaxID=320188 RepID=A0AAV1J4A8_9NEOP